MANLKTATAYLKKIQNSSDDGGGLVIESDVCARPFSHEAAVFYLVDRGDSFEYVTHQMREAAGLSEDELHALGIQNLGAHVENMQFRQLGDITFFTGSGDFEASMILADWLWDSVASQYPNGPAVVIPARDVLVVCDRGNAAALEQLRTLAAKVLSTPQTHPIGTEVYVRGNGGWGVLGADVPSEPDPEPDLAQFDAFMDGFMSDWDGSEQIEISNAELFGRQQPTSEQFVLLSASGYNWYPDTQTFRKIAAGQPGAAERPWLTPEWSPKKNGFFKKMLGAK